MQMHGRIEQNNIRKIYTYVKGKGMKIEYPINSMYISTFVSIFNNAFALYEHKTKKHTHKYRKKIIKNFNIFLCVLTAWTLWCMHNNTMVFHVKNSEFEIRFRFWLLEFWCDHYLLAIIRNKTYLLYRKWKETMWWSMIVNVKKNN